MAVNTVMLSVANKPNFAECCYDECRYAECRGGKFGADVKIEFFVRRDKYLIS
jgi:hypothetical protein